MVNRYLSERHRVELAMPLIAMLDIVKRGMREDTADRRKCLLHLSKAVDEALDVNSKGRKLFTRAYAAYNDMVRPYEAIGADMKIYGLAVYYVLKCLTDTDYLAIGEDDDYAKALELFLPAVTPAEATENYDHARARVGAVEIFELAHGRGLYHGVDWSAI